MNWSLVIFIGIIAFLLMLSILAFFTKFIAEIWANEFARAMDEVLYKYIQK